LYFIDPPTYESTYNCSYSELSYVIDAFVISAQPRAISGIQPQNT
jgi:hypothetical protein